MKYVINSQEHPSHWKGQRFLDWKYTPGYQCDTRDVWVQYINYVIKTDIPDESDVELYQLVKRLQTHSHSKY